MDIHLMAFISIAVVILTGLVLLILADLTVKFTIMRNRNPDNPTIIRSKYPPVNARPNDLWQSPTGAMYLYRRHRDGLFDYWDLMLEEVEDVEPSSGSNTEPFQEWSGCVQSQPNGEGQATRKNICT